MKRWQVQRGPVRHKGRTYLPGDYMPENFTERDRARNMYSRRLVLVEVPDEPSALPTSEAKTPEAPKVNQEATPTKTTATIDTVKLDKPITPLKQEEIPKSQAKLEVPNKSTGTIKVKTK